MGIVQQLRFTVKPLFLIEFTVFCAGDVTFVANNMVFTLFYTGFFTGLFASLTQVHS